jgi:hypothetical protein
MNNELDSLLAKVDAETDDNLDILRTIKLYNGSDYIGFIGQDNNRTGFYFENPANPIGFSFAAGTGGKPNLASNFNSFSNTQGDTGLESKNININTDRIQFQTMDPGGSVFENMQVMYPDSIVNNTGRLKIYNNPNDGIFVEGENPTLSLKNTNSTGFDYRFVGGTNGYNIYGNYDGSLMDVTKNAWQMNLNVTNDNLAFRRYPVGGSGWDSLLTLRPGLTSVTGGLTLNDNSHNIFMGDTGNDRPSLKFTNGAATNNNSFYFYQASEGSGVFLANGIPGTSTQEDVTKGSPYMIFDAPHEKIAMRIMEAGGSTYDDKLEINLDSITNHTGQLNINGTVGKAIEAKDDGSRVGLKMRNPNINNDYYNSFFVGSGGGLYWIYNWDYSAATQGITDHPSWRMDMLGDIVGLDHILFRRMSAGGST